MQIKDEIDRIFSQQNDYIQKTPTKKKNPAAEEVAKKRRSVQNINIFQHFWKNNVEENNNSHNASLNENKSLAKTGHRKTKKEKSNYFIGGSIDNSEEKKAKKNNQLLSLDYTYNPNKISPIKKSNFKHKEKKHHTENIIELPHPKSHHVKKYKEEENPNCEKMDHDNVASPSSYDTNKINHTNKHKRKDKRYNTNKNAHSFFRFLNLRIEKIKPISEITNWVEQVKEKDSKRKLSLAVLNQLTSKPFTLLPLGSKKNKSNQSIIVEEDPHQSNRNPSENSISLKNKTPRGKSPRGNKTPCGSKTPGGGGGKSPGKRSLKNSDQSPKKSFVIPVKPLTLIEPKRESNIPSAIPVKPTQIDSKNNDNNIQAFSPTHFLIKVSKSEYSNKKKGGPFCCLPIN